MVRNEGVSGITSSQLQMPQPIDVLRISVGIHTSLSTQKVQNVCSYFGEREKPLHLGTVSQVFFGIMQWTGC